MIFFLIILGLLAIVFVSAVLKNLKTIKDLEGGGQYLYRAKSLDSLTGEQRILFEGTDNYWLGFAQADIVIVEFADFSCSFCKKSYTDIRELSVNYKDKVKIIFRDFPIINEHSGDLALAARCAGEQGLFWPMHDKLFQKQGVNSRRQYAELANQVGADIERFTDCFDSKKYTSDIEKDYRDAVLLGLTGTPTWFINGSKMEGSVPYETLAKIIDDTLDYNNKK